MAQKPIETITCFRFLPVYQESPINKQFPFFSGFPGPVTIPKILTIPDIKFPDNSHIHGKSRPSRNDQKPITTYHRFLFHTCSQESSSPTNKGNIDQLKTLKMLANVSI